MLRRHPALAPLAVLLFVAAVAGRAAAADTLVGTFADDRLTVTIAPAPAGKGYSGTVALAGAPAYPFTAAPTPAAKDTARPELAGQFTAAGKTFPFTARLEDPDTLVLKTGDATYRLARQGAPAAPAEAESLPRPASRDIDAAVNRAKAYLYAAQQNGNWDLPQRLPEPTKEMRRLDEIQNSTQWGGITALCAYTLLAAGDAPQDKRLAPALEFLKTAEVDGTYALATRLLVWNALPASAQKEARALAKRDADLLLKNKRTEGAAKGLFRYLSDDVGADHSASQFAVLGLWAADGLGAEVPTAFWRETQDAWLRDQRQDGGWPYAGPLLRQTQVTPSMTAAGVATLFITSDALRAPTADCRGNASNKPLDAGIAWIDAHADAFFTAGNDFPFYSLYGLERIGLASGLKYLGRQDWYRRGTAALLQSQAPDGSFGAGPADTCFAILFLVRGRAPLVMSKLHYTLDTRGDTPKPANWNQRPRDAANVTRWLSKQLERELAWQIVDLQGKPEDLHDAPILYLAGNQQLQFSEADEDKLRQFVRQGGLILGHADCAAPNFATSFKKLGQKLFGPYEFRELPAGHVLYAGLFPRTTWKAPPQVQGLSNGARELMLLLPTGDPARWWQTAGGGIGVGGHESAFQLLANTFLYCSENREFRHRGDSTWIARDGKNSGTRTMRVARLQHDFNWNPEPGGWQRLSNLLHNEDGVDLTIDTVQLGDNKLSAKDHPLAHLTAAGRLKLTDAQRAELKTYLESGGTLLVDAAGGDAEAATALEAEISSLLPPAAAKLATLPDDHALYAHLGVKPAQIAYRPYAARRSLGKLTGPRLRAATIPATPPGAATQSPGMLVYSAEDLSVGLVGHGVDGVYGYTPASATALVRSIILSVADRTPSPN